MRLRWTRLLALDLPLVGPPLDSDRSVELQVETEAHSVRDESREPDLRVVARLHERVVCSRHLSPRDPVVAQIGTRLRLADGELYQHSAMQASEAVGAACTAALARVLEDRGYSRVLTAAGDSTGTTGFRRFGILAHLSLRARDRDVLVTRRLPAGDEARTLQPEHARPTPRAAARRVAEILRGQGARGLWWKLLGETVYRRVVLVALDLREQPPLLEAKVPLEFGYLVDSEVDAYVRYRERAEAPEPREDILARLERGERCFVARHEGTIACSSWVSPKDPWVPDLATRLRLADGEIYHYDAFTDPASRNLGAYSAAATRMFRDLAESGYNTVIGIVRADDPRALRSHLKAGYRSSGSFGWLRAGRTSYDVMVTDRARTPA